MLDKLPQELLIIIVGEHLDKWDDRQTISPTNFTHYLLMFVFYHRMLMKLCGLGSLIRYDIGKKMTRKLLKTSMTPQMIKHRELDYKNRRSPNTSCFFNNHRYKRQQSFNF